MTLATTYNGRMTVIMPVNTRNKRFIERRVPAVQRERCAVLYIGGASAADIEW